MLRASIIAAISAASALFFSAAAAHALDLEKVLNSPKPCFKRIYTSAHLAKHPRQTVQSIGIETRGRASRTAPFEMEFSIRRRGDRARFRSAAVCSFETTERVRCDLEGDGGIAKFAIGELNGKKRIRLTTDELRFEGEAGFYTFGKQTDDAIFYLGSYRIHHCPV